MYIKNRKKSLNLATEIFYFTNKLNANLQNKNLAIAIESRHFRSKKTLKVHKSSLKKFACTNRIYKTITCFFVAVYYHLVFTDKIKRDLQPVIFDRSF